MRAAVGLALVALVGGCAEARVRPSDAAIDALVSPDASDPAEDAGDPAEDFIARRNRVLCEREIRCGAYTRLNDRFGLCHPSTRRDELEPGRPIAESSIRWCAPLLDRLEAEGCGTELFDRIDDEIFACLRLRSAPDPLPVAPLGERCGPDRGCDDGAYCAMESDCVGVCTPRLSPGAACARGEECVAGYRCLPEESGTCRPEDACDTPHDCEGRLVPGLYCVGSRCVDVPPSEGELCRTDSFARPACASGFECSEGRCVRPRTLGEPCGVGLPCDANGTCLLDTCVPRGRVGEVCSLGSCAAAAPYCVVPPGGVLGACALDPDGAVCLPVQGLLYDRSGCPSDYACSDGLCRRRADLGEACDADRPCGVGARCATGTCRRVVSPDAPCGADALCPIAFTCRDARCVPWPVLGEPCDDELLCLDGVCVDGRCAELPPGAPCAYGPGSWSPCATVCASGVCAPFAELGERCDVGWDACRPGAICDWGHSETCIPACE